MTHPPIPANDRALLRRVAKARKFPTNTCPASRHAALIGEALMKRKPYPMLQEEPEHCAGSILATVAALWEQRTAGWSVTLRERIDELLVQHGSLRAAALVLKIDAGYLSRLRTGAKGEPSEALLRRMGLRRRVSFERIARASTEEGS